MHWNWESLTSIEDYPYTQLPKQMSYPHAILQVRKGGILDHQPCWTNDMNSLKCSTNDMNSPKVTGVRQQMRREQPGHKCNSPPLACSPIARAHNLFNTHNDQRWTLFDSMEDQVVTTHAKQTNDKPRNEELLCLAEQRPRYFLPFRCAYVSHINTHFTSTRAPPASRDSWSPMHVDVALRKQMRPLTYTDPCPSAVMHPRGTAGVGGGTRPRFSQIAVPGLLSSTGVALASDSLPFP